MALRTIFVQFSTNANQLASGFATSTSASRTLAEAQDKLALANLKVAESEQRLMLLNNSRLATNGMRIKAEEDVAKAQLTQVGAEQQVAAATANSEAANARRGATIGKLTTLIGVGMVVALGEASKAALQFDQQLAQVGAVSGTTGQSLNVIGQAVLDLSTRVPQSSKDLLTALAEIEREGFRGAAAFAVLQGAAIAATVSMESIGNATTSIVQTLSAFAGQGVTAAEVTDLLIVGFQNSQGSMTDFAKALAQVGPIAGLMKVPIAEVAAALAQMSKEGLTAQQAGLALNRFLLQAIRPGTELNNVVKELGKSTQGMAFSSAEAAVQTLGLNGVLGGLLKVAGGSVEKLEQLYPSVRAFRGLAALAANDGKDFAATLQLMSDKTQLAAAASKAYETQSKTFANQLKIAHNEVHAATVELGQAFLPTITHVAEAVGGLAHSFASAGPGAHQAAAAILAAGAAAGIATGLFLVLRSVLASTSLTMGPIGLAAAAIGVAVVGATAVIGHFAAESERTRKIVADLTAAYVNEAQGIQGAVEAQLQQTFITDKSAQSFQKFGISMKDVTDSILQVPGSTSAASRSIDGFEQSVGLSQSAMLAAGKTTEDYNRIHKDLIDTYNGVHGAQRRLGTDLNDLGHNISGVGGVVDRATEAVTNFFEGQSKTDKEISAGIKIISDIGQKHQENTTAMKTAEEQTRALDAAQKENAISLLTTGRASDSARASLTALKIPVEQIDAFLKPATQDAKDLAAALGAFTDVNKIFQDASDKLKGFNDAIGAAKDALSTRKSDLTDAASSLQNTFQEQERAGQDALDTLRQQIQDQEQATQDSLSGLSTTLAHTVGATKQYVDARVKQAEAAAKAQKEADQDLIHSKEETLKHEKQIDQDRIKSSQQAAKSYKITIDDWINSLNGQAKETADWQDTLNKIAADGHIVLADTLRKMGKDGVDLVAQFAKGETASGKFADGTEAAMKKTEAAINHMTDATKFNFDNFSQATQDSLQKQNDLIVNLVAIKVGGFGDIATQIEKLAAKGDIIGAAQEASDIVTRIKDKTQADSLRKLNEMLHRALNPNDIADQVQALFTLASSHLDGLTADEISHFLRGLTMDAGQAKEVATQWTETIASALDAASQDAGLALHVQVQLEKNPNLSPLASYVHDPLANAPSSFVPPPPPVGSVPRQSSPTGSGRGGVHEGGLLDGQFPVGVVQYNDEGHFAQIGAKGVTRVWNEPETDGEAYIPLAESKRNRSVAIWRQVGHIFGVLKDSEDHWAKMIGITNRPTGANGDWSYPNMRDSAWNNHRPAGGMLTGAGQWNNTAPAITVVHVPVPERRVEEVNLNGVVIKGISFDDAVREARRMKRLAGASRAGARNAT